MYTKRAARTAWSCDYVGYVNQDCGVSSGEIYNFLKEARGNHLDTCGGDLFSNHSYEYGDFKYETVFQGDVHSLLQVENNFYNNQLAAQQISAGRSK